jgi:hypothetical protein
VKKKEKERKRKKKKEKERKRLPTIAILDTSNSSNRCSSRRTGPVYSGLYNP